MGRSSIRWFAILCAGWPSVGSLWGTDIADALVEPELTEADLSHWAFQPVRRENPPQVANASQARNGIDRFILDGLEQEVLSLMPSANRRTLIRRLSFDLRGLPPTPDEVRAFLEDVSDSAYSNLMDRFLDSPSYGERWGQHWLDVARFAESDGFEHDYVRENAWQYRDWVEPRYAVR